MNRIEVIKYYDNMIDDIENEELRDKLREDLTTIDELFFSLEHDIEKAIDDQESNEYPSDSEEWYNQRMYTGRYDF